MNIYIDESGSINKYATNDQNFVVSMIHVLDSVALERTYKRFISSNYDMLLDLDSDKVDDMTGKITKHGGRMFRDGKFRELKGAQFDRQILEIISQNARIPFKDVAAECGVSRAAIHQRVQRLIDLGVNVGSGYHVNPKSHGYRTCTYVGIKLEKGSMYKAVVAELQKFPEIVECHFTTGPYTMLTKVYARDNEHLMDLLNNKMQEIPGVVATETLISLEQSIKKEIPIRVEK